jgi:hypothetical protein
MQEYHFTLQYDDYEAKLALGGNWSLYEFAAFLINTIGFDFDHAFQFCDNLRRPYRSSEVYSLFADIGEGNGEPGVKETLVAEVFKARKRMVFHFDYGDDWFFLVTCTGIKESTAKRRFGKVISSQGTPPEQYPDYEE